MVDRPRLIDQRAPMPRRDPQGAASARADWGVRSGGVAGGSDTAGGALLTLGSMVLPARRPQAFALGGPVHPVAGPACPDHGPDWWRPDSGRDRRGGPGGRTRQDRLTCTIPAD